MKTMKKTLRIILTAVFACGLFACSEEPANEHEHEHVHSFSSDYSYNAEGHFHVCECGAHDEIIPHTFGDYYVVKDPTREEEGAKAHKCEVCSYEETSPIAKLVYKLISVYEGDSLVKSYKSDVDGNYVLDVPADQPGKYFAGYYLFDGTPFRAYGQISQDFNVRLTTTNEPFQVSDEDSLDKALKSSVRTVDLASDLEITRPHYILTDFTLNSKDGHTIIRSTSFGGDMFVIGVDENDKEAASFRKPPVVTFNQTGSDFLDFDGNKNLIYADPSHPTVVIDGSMFFVSGLANVNFNGDIVIENNKKVSNKRVLSYDSETSILKPYISKAEKVGGAAFINIDSVINFDGTTIKNHAVNQYFADDYESSYGGAIFSYGEINVLNASFTNNYGSFGSVVYSARIFNAYRMDVTMNHSYNYGAIYLADSQYSNGRFTPELSGGIYFENNIAESSGGAIFVSEDATMYGEKMNFTSNGATNNGGAIASKGILEVKDCNFTTNSANTKGGAIYAYYPDSTGQQAGRHTTITSCYFSENRGSLGGAVGFGSDIETDAKNLAEHHYVIATIDDCIFQENVAQLRASDNKYGHGGAIYAQKCAQVSVKNSNFNSNSAAAYGGVLYAVSSDTPEGSTATRVDFDTCFFGSNHSENNGGALYYNNAANATISNCNATNNSTASGKFGGFLFVSGKGRIDLINIASISNSAGKGGFIYITTGGTKVYIYSGSTSSCSASDAEYKNIYSNSASAEVHVKGKTSGKYFSFDGTLFSGSGELYDIE